MPAIREKGEPVTREPAQPLQLGYLIKAGAAHSMTGETYRSVGVRGAEIVAVSAEPDGLDDLAGDGTVVVDAGDLTLLPAFADSHEHLMEASRNTLLVPVGQARSVAEFTGLLDAAARDAPPGGEELATALATSSGAYAALGVGTIREAMINLDELLDYQDARDRRLLRVRVRAMIRVGNELTQDEAIALIDGLGARSGFGDDWLRIWGLKFVMDGGVEGAALEQPYANDPFSSGHLNWDPAVMTRVCAEAVRGGWRIGTHAVGDRAVRTLLDVYEAVVEEVGPPPRWTLVIEHGLLADAEQRSRAVRGGFGITVQHLSSPKPTPATSGFTWAASTASADSPTPHHGRDRTGTRPAADRARHQVALAARRPGAIIRPLGDVIVLMPPLAIAEADLQRLVVITAAAISQVTSARPRAAA